MVRRKYSRHLFLSLSLVSCASRYKVPREFSLFHFCFSETFDLPWMFFSSRHNLVAFASTMFTWIQRTRAIILLRNWLVCVPLTRSARSYTCRNKEWGKYFGNRETNDIYDSWKLIKIQPSRHVENSESASRFLEILLGINFSRRIFMILDLKFDSVN